MFGVYFSYSIMVELPYSKTGSKTIQVVVMKMDIGE